MCFLISNNIAVILNPIKPNLNTIWILDLLNKYCVLCQQKNNRKWFIMANHLSILPWTALQYEQSKRCCKFGNWAGIAGILNSLLMDWLVRKPTLHWNSSGYFKLVDYMVAWLSLGYVNSGVFRFRFGCWSPGSCLYLSPARNLVNQRTDWTSFFLPPPARCFFFLYLCCFSSCPNPLGSGLLGGKAERFEFSSEDQELIFLITWMCPTDFPHCEVITSFIQVLQRLYYSG